MCDEAVDVGYLLQLAPAFTDRGLELKVDEMPRGSRYAAAVKARMEAAQSARDAVGPGCLALVLSLGLALGCTCEPRPAPKDQEKTLPPLVDVGTPAEIRAEIHPALGAISPRPVLLVFSQSAEPCALARQKQPRDVHVLCAQPEDAAQGSAASDKEARMKQALSFLKDKYRRYVAGSPVLLFCDEHASGFCFQLMLREPLVFAHAYLPGLAPQQLTATTLYTLFSGGVKTVILSAPLPADQAPLLAMAERGGLALKVAGPSATAGQLALDTLRQQDQRLSAVPRAQR